MFNTTFNNMGKGKTQLSLPLVNSQVMLDIEIYPEFENAHAGLS